MKYPVSLAEVFSEMSPVYRKAWEAGPKRQRHLWQALTGQARGHRGWRVGDKEWKGRDTGREGNLVGTLMGANERKRAKGGWARY